MFRSSIPVLCYHNVSEVDGHSPARFAEHLDAVLDAGFRTISSRDLLKIVRGEMKSPPKSVVLTFDNGHVSNWLACVPELEKRGMTGTFFLSTDFTRQGHVRSVENAPVLMSMPEAFKQAYQGDCTQFINEAEARAILDKGMEIFSQGCRHQATFRTLTPLLPMGDPRSEWGAWSIYPKYQPEWMTHAVASAYVYDGFWPVIEEGDKLRYKARSKDARLALCREDFKKSLERIRELNGYDEQLFCWPWGQFAEDAQAELEKAGYAGAFTLEHGPNCEGTDPYRFNRLDVDKDRDGDWVQQQLSRYGSGLKSRVFFKRYRKKPEVKSVLYTTDSTNLSGGSRQMVNNIKIMSDMGIRTHSILHPDSAIHGALEGLDVNVIPFDGFRSYLKAGKFLKDVIHKHNVDVVHSFHNRAYKMGVIAKLLGTKFKLFINRGVASRPNEVFFLWTALSNGVICNSDACGKVLRKHMVREKQINLVYNAFIGEDFGEPRPRKKRGTRFIYVGNAAANKGHEAYLKAAAILCEGDARDLEFVSVGIKPSEEARFDHVLTPEVRQRWRSTGKIPHDEVLDELRFADVICIPPREGIESFPNTLIEGFNAGLPGVGSKAGGIPEMLHDGFNGFLCEIDDVHCLADKMLMLANDPAMRHKMGRLGYAVARKLLTPEIKGHALMRVYMGEQLYDLLPMEKAAEGLNLDGNPYDDCKH